jgi:hypothetical protein
MYNNHLIESMQAFIASLQCKRKGALWSVCSIGEEIHLLGVYSWIWQLCCIMGSTRILLILNRRGEIRLDIKLISTNLRCMTIRESIFSIHNMKPDVFQQFIIFCTSSKEIGETSLRACETVSAFVTSKCGPGTWYPSSLVRY